MTDIEYDKFMHKSAHQAWKSSVLTDPVTKQVLGLVDQDRKQFSVYTAHDTHADICLQDYLARPSLKDEQSCQCKMYADMCVKEAQTFKPRFRSVRANNLRVLKLN